ncbi:MAG: hypothetical protein LBJ32_03685 [Oscillospiraceae bacterium]|jgi:hypothetical protein|nr:hypothetical protein [Oscillospiraceae bacterium]
MKENDNKANENFWKQKVSGAPAFFRRVAYNDFLFLDKGKLAALEIFFEHIVSLNPKKSELDILHDRNLMTLLDVCFGSFCSSRSGLRHEIREVSASEALVLLIDEKVTRKQIESFQKIFSTISNNLVPITGGFTILILGSLSGVLKDFFQFSKTALEKLKRKFIFERRKYSSDPYEMLQVMQENLKKNLVGQERPISEICKIVIGWLANVEEKKCPLLLVFSGSSGAGKTLAATEISKIIYGSELDPSKFITSSSIKLGTGDSTPAEKLFSVDSQLVINLRRNPYQIIIFDDHDKSQKNDPNNSVLETLAQIKESGMMPVRDKNGKLIFVDVKSTVFIVTTNQLSSCWGGKDSEESLKDPTRTNYPVDQSLARRFNCVEFNKLDEESYKKILKPKIDLFIKKCKESHGIICNFNEKYVLNNLAKDCVLSDRGARGCNDLMVEAWGTFIEFVLKKKQEGHVVKNAKMEFNSKRRFIFSLS